MDGNRLSSRGGGLTDAGSAVWDRVIDNLSDRRQLVPARPQTRAPRRRAGHGLDKRTHSFARATERPGGEHRLARCYSLSLR